MKGIIGVSVDSVSFDMVFFVADRCFMLRPEKGYVCLRFDSLNLYYKILKTKSSVCLWFCLGFFLLVESEASESRARVLPAGILREGRAVLTTQYILHIHTVWSALEQLVKVVMKYSLLKDSRFSF